MKLKTKYLIFGLCLFISTSLMSQTQWDSQGALFATAAGGQIQLNSISDDNGGTFLVWRDEASSDYDILAQWIDARGNKRWGNDGILVCQNAGDQTFPVLASDGNGGIVIAWWDESGNEGNIYAQRINQNGQAQWNASGLAICTATGDQRLPQIISNANKSIIVWIDKRDNNNNLYGQCVDNEGIIQWPSNGLAIATGSQPSHELISDGNGGAYIVYRDERNGNFDIYAQRINSSGVAQWMANGLPLVTEIHNQLTPKAALTTNEDLIVVWQDERGSYDNIYAQKISSDGIVSWTTDGIAVASTEDNQTNATICSDDAGGVIIAWWDQRNGDYDIYAQRLASDGSEQWQSSGVPVIQLYGDQFSPHILKDSAKGAFISWIDSRKGTDVDLYAQHLDLNGNLLWDEEGLLISNESNNQSGQTMISDLSGGFLVFWNDERNSIPQLYGQSVNDALHVLTPDINTVWAGSVEQQIEWEFRTSVDFTSLNISYSINGNDGFPNTVETNIPIAQSQYTWSVPLIESTTIQLKIQGVNADLSSAYTYYSKPFTIDATGPDAFDLLSPSNNMSTSPTPTFQWQATQDNLTDIAYYQLWIDGQLFQDQILQTQYTITEEQRFESGNHTWKVKAVNGVGLVTESSQTWNFIGSFDDTPPAVFHLVSPADDAWVKGGDIQLTWTASNDGENALLKYQLWIDDILALDNIAADATSHTINTLTSGQHTWYLVAMDDVLNTRHSEETWNLYVDGNVPSAFDLLSPLNDTWTNDPTPTFQWYQSEDVETASVTYQVWIDDTNISNTTDTLYTLPSGSALQDGLHQWKVIATDQVLNTTQSTHVFQVFVDTQVPDVFTLTTPSDNSFSQQAEQTFRWQQAEDAGSGIDHYELWIHEQLVQGNISSTESNPVTLTEGPHTWYVKAFDHLNQVRQATSFQLTLDWTPPETFNLLLPEDQSDFSTSQPEFQWEAATDQTSGIAKYQLIIDNEVQVDNIGVNKTTIKPNLFISFGAHTWKMRAVDKAGNTRDSEARGITISNTPPHITSQDTLELTEDIPFQYVATAEDNDGNDIQITFGSLPDWFHQSGDTLTGIPTEGLGNTFFDIKATDGVLSDSIRVVVLVTPVNDAPIITSTNSATATENEAFEYVGTATDAENQAITITYEDYPNWLSVVEGKLQGTPGSSDVNTTFTVKASDGEKTSALVVNLTVTQINDPPVFIVGLPTIAAESVDTLIIELDNYVEDPDNDKSQLSWQYEILNGGQAFIVINPMTRKLFIYMYSIKEEVQVRITVRDPEGGSDSDILIITKDNTGIVQSSSQIPETLVLSPPFPNPFNPTTSFRFGLPRKFHVQLSIYNLLGQLMDTPLKQSMSAGMYEFQWTSHNLPSGIYIYTLQIGAKKKTGRLILMQ